MSSELTSGSLAQRSLLRGFRGDHENVPGYPYHLQSKYPLYPHFSLSFLNSFHNGVQEEKGLVQMSLPALKSDNFSVLFSRICYCWKVAPGSSNLVHLAGEIFYLQRKSQDPLFPREQALHCYGYRIHLFWIFVLFKSFEKISQTRVSPFNPSTWPSGEEGTAGGSSFLDSLPKVTVARFWVLGISSTGACLHVCGCSCTKSWEHSRGTCVGRQYRAANFYFIAAIASSWPSVLATNFKSKLLSATELISFFKVSVFPESYQECKWKCFFFFKC